MYNEVKAAMYGGGPGRLTSKDSFAASAAVSCCSKTVKQMADKVISLGQNDTADNEVDWIGVRD